MAPATTTAGAPVRRLAVLYDAECPLCTALRDWLLRQPRLVPLDLVAAGSEEARARFPGLDHGTTFEEITVVGDAGQVYRGAAAWIVVLWALRRYRSLAHRLSTPAGAVLARGAVLAAAKVRQGGRWGGNGYRRDDGWVYEPTTGWVFVGPACGGGARATR
ncbi:thiol-disulfide oxidoreductase DCC family protein [Streptomyces sp. NPDC048182]|uniref:thiol-disulfide oxidoreductase DCC family protein n=1 Tax=Streptomyces sp. NPDC048182 TaxID=3365507 RepID=UPI00372034FD